MISKKLLSFFAIAFLTFNVVAQQFQFPNPLHIPDTLTGTIFDLLVKPSKKQFLPGDSTNTYGINGDYLGPTLMINKGDTVYMNVTNELGETTTMHWHGMHVAPEDDGGPHTPIADGETWSPDFEVLDEATTFWYHPHLHHFTAKQVYNGAAGMIIVRDDNPVGDLLPHTYGVDEFPLIVQDKSFDATNQLIFTALADTIMVNGTLGAYLEVPAQMVRFHVLNASNQRAYNFGLPPQLNVWQIGSDGGFLENRVPMNRLQLTPGERAEIVIDFGGMQANQVTRMVSFSSELGDGLSGGPRGPRGPRGNMLDSLDFEVMEFRVVPRTANAITTIPVNLNTYNRPSITEVDVFRTKTFTVDSSGFPFYINGTLMDMSVINDTVLLDDVEVWTLINATDVAHPWHIHDIQFFILDINGNPPPPQLAGRKDVIIVQPFDTIRYITKFDDFANDTIPYMFHCHNLFHEDGGMMGQFIVTNTVGLEERRVEKAKDYKVFPNPTNDYVFIERVSETLAEGTIKSVLIYDMNGKRYQLPYTLNENALLKVSFENLKRGIYLINIKYKNGDSAVLKINKEG